MSGGETLWLVRHGHTVVHGTNGVAGRSDVALSAHGREAVGALGEALARHLDASSRAPRWYASPLERTRDTAAALRAATASRHSPLALDARLVELDFGDWEGSTWDAVHRDHGAALAAWGEDWVERAPPGGESFRAQAARCGAWFDDAFGDANRAGGGIDDGIQGDGEAVVRDGREEDRSNARDDEARNLTRGVRRAADATIVVTHGGCVRALACRLLDWPLTEAMRFVVDPASVYRFDRDPRLASGWRLAGANLSDFD